MKVKLLIKVPFHTVWSSMGHIEYLDRLCKLALQMS